MSMRNINRIAEVINNTLNYDGRLSYSRVLDAISLLCDEVKKTDDVEWYSEPYYIGDIIEGAYWFCVDYHSGQASKEYSLQCKIGNIFTPGSMHCGCSMEESQQVYELLSQKQA